MKFTALTSACQAVLHAIYRTFHTISRTLAKAAHAIYTTCDAIVEQMVECFRSLQRILCSATDTPKRKWLLRTLYALLTLLFLVLLTAFIIEQCLFVVPVSASAVVTRLGKFSREVEPGLHLRIPYAERYFIVDTNNLLEERFGFVQVPSLIKKITTDPQEQLVLEQYEMHLLAAEKQEGPNVLSNHNGLEGALQQKQRLTHDYLRKQLTPTTKPSPEGVITQLQAQQAQVQDVEQMGISLNGRIPVTNEMQMITGDLNIIRMTWTLQYQITDAKDYLFNSRDVQRNIRDIARAEMSAVVGESSFDYILSTGRDDIEKKVANRIQQTLDQYQVGITVKKVIILDALPAKEVISAFNEVNKAAQDMEKSIYDAEQAYQHQIPEAHGQAQLLIAKAQAYATKILNQADGETTRYDLILKQYEKVPEVTRDRLYLDAMETLFNKAPTTIIDSKLHGILPIFMAGTPKAMPTEQTIPAALTSLASDTKATMADAHNNAITANATANLVP